MDTAVSTGRLFEGVAVDDGYEFIGAGAAAGWKAVPAWGEKGWDLGDWPLVVVMFREVEDYTGPGEVGPLYERATYVEGDITVERFAAEADRDAATDETAMHFWRLGCVPWIEEETAEALRGPFRRTRAA